MDYALFENILDQLKFKTIAIHLYNWGEPLLLNDFPYYCELAKKRGFVLSASTNLNIQMDEIKASELIESGLDRLIISLDGLSKQTYSLYRKNGDFARVMQNINLLVKTKKLLHRKYPLLCLQLVRHKGNEGDAKLFGQACRKLGADHYSIVDIILPLGEGVNPELIDSWITQDRFAGQQKAFDIPNGELGLPCFHLWKLPVINCDGSVSPCCYVYLQKNDMGNLIADRFEAVWNSQAFRDARLLFKDNAGVFEPCYHCTILKEHKIN